MGEALERRVAVALAPRRQHDGERAGIERGLLDAVRRGRADALPARAGASASRPSPASGERPGRRGSGARGGRAPCVARARRRRGSSARAGRGGADGLDRGVPGRRAGVAGARGDHEQRARLECEPRPRARAVSTCRRDARRAAGERAWTGQPVPEPLVSGEVAGPLEEAQIVQRQRERRVAADGDGGGRRQPDDVGAAGQALEPWPPGHRGGAVQHARGRRVPDSHDVRPGTRRQGCPARQHDAHLDVGRDSGEHAGEVRGHAAPGPARLRPSTPTLMRGAPSRGRAARRRTSRPSRGSSGRRCRACGVAVARCALRRAARRRCPRRSARRRSGSARSPPARRGLALERVRHRQHPGRAIAIGVGPGWGACSSARPTSYSPQVRASTRKLQPVAAAEVDPARRARGADAVEIPGACERPELERAAQRRGCRARTSSRRRGAGPARRDLRPRHLGAARETVTAGSNTAAFSAAMRCARK